MTNAELKQTLQLMLRERQVSRSAQAGEDPADVDPTVARVRAREAMEIEDALEKLMSGTYGECSKCGGLIEEARLKARPFATHCVDCATKAERLRPRYGVVDIRNVFGYMV